MVVYLFDVVWEMTCPKVNINLCREALQSSSKEDVVSSWRTTTRLSADMAATRTLVAPKQISSDTAVRQWNISRRLRKKRNSQITNDCDCTWDDYVLLLYRY